MEDDDVDAYRTALEPSGRSDDFSSLPLECPACGSLGQVYGSPSPDWEADWDVSDGQAYAAGAYVDAITFIHPAFQCRICGLGVPATMLEVAGIATTFRHGDAFDVDSATQHFTQQIVDDYWEP